MKDFRAHVSNGMAWGLGFFGIGILASVSYAAYSTLGASAGDGLSAGKWNELVTYAVPPGAIMAFSGSSCPSNWSEYLPARGRFLRGIDNGAGNDPDGTRAIGNVQSDAFQGHYHSSAFSVDHTGLPNVYPQWPNGYSSTSENAVERGALNAVTDGTNGTPRTANETRPKNVAVLFCIKN